MKINKDKCINQRRMEFYKFDIAQEQYIYKYLCTGNIKEMKKISPDTRFNTYGQWKQYILDKYHDFSDQKLVEFSHFLNQCLRKIRPVYEYWKMMIPVILTLIIDKLFKFLVSMEDFKLNSLVEAIVNCMLVGGTLIFFIYLMARIAIPLSNGENERNFYLDYKEIIDEMIEKRKISKRINDRASEEI